MKSWKSKFKLRYKGVIHPGVMGDLIEFIEKIPCEVCEQFKEDQKKLLQGFGYRKESS